MSCTMILLPYGQGSNSVMQSDWLKTFECDVMIGHYYAVMPAHYVKCSKILDLERSTKWLRCNGFKHDTSFVVIRVDEHALSIG